MDTPTITHLSLCSGYGGIDLGLRRAIGSSLRTVAYAEIEAFACELLLARMEGGQIDPAPIWPDLKSFPWASFRDRVDILSGGYPCQPFSSAGKRLGKEDPRHLWPYIADGIRILRPRLCFFENVEGHISLGLRDVIEELERLGYEATWGIFSASEVGAPHQRKRVFILGELADTGFSARCAQQRKQQEEHAKKFQGGSELAGAFWPSRPGQPQHGCEPPRVVGNAASRQDDRREPEDVGQEAGRGQGGNDAADGSGEDLGDTAKPGRQGRRGAHDKKGPVQRPAEPDRGAGQRELESEQRQTQPSLGRDAHGAPRGMGHAELFTSCDNRIDELRLLGNGVVPAVAERAFLTLLHQLQCPSSTR